ncbi:hypothetical protein [Streptomyces sp. NPDC050528]|uniref:hypothetical protein n=1 Tax=unclassified Streptomyces TaxID=2593676 RepID=UPI00378A4928
MRPSSFEQRAEDDWPLARTEWTRFSLHAGDGSLSTEAPVDRRTAEFAALGEGLTFITGPAAARLVVASSTAEATCSSPCASSTPSGVCRTAPGIRTSASTR